MSDGDPAPAPLPLRWVEELVNTRSVEFGTDDVAAADDLAAWLQERDLLPPAVRVTPAAHAPSLAGAGGAAGADRRQQRRWRARASRCR